MAVAALPTAVGLGAASYHQPARFNHGFDLATTICAVVLLIAAALAAALVDNDVLHPAGVPVPEPEGPVNCSVGAPPLLPAPRR
jgi:hypothetical protein